MKQKGNFLIALLLFVNAFVFISALENRPLVELYKTGSVRFIQVLSIDFESMPKGIYIENVTKIAVDKLGNVYACDFGANDIKKFDRNGNFIATIGREGQGPGDFNRPFDIAITNNRMIVCDMGNQRLSALTLEGEFVDSASILMEEGRPEMMRALPNGNIIVGSEKTYFSELDRPQNYIVNLYSPTLEKIKLVYTQEIWRNKYKEIGGRLTNVIQPFSPMIYWDISPDGKIVIGKSNNYKILIYDSTGNRTHSFSKPYKPVRITEKDKEAFFNNIAYSVDGVVKRAASDQLKKNTDFPKFKPAFRNLLVDSEGNILVCVYSEDRQEELRLFDAFHPNGEYIGIVRIVGGDLFPLRADIVDRSFWKIQTDEDGFNNLVKYIISE